MFRFLFTISIFCFCLIQTSFAQLLDERPRQIIAQNQQTPSSTGNHSAEELRQLVLFKDVVVIQRRFFPKVSRFEFHPSIRWIINDPFHYHFMGFGKLGYHFSEPLGIELYGGIVFGPNRKVTNDLNRIQIQVSGVVSPKWLYGAAVKWSPLYGKFGGVGGTILPFDMYFSLGGGMSHLETMVKKPGECILGTVDCFEDCNANAITVNIETGQLIPFSKSSALRWSVGWFWHPKIFDWECKSGRSLGSDQAPGGLFTQDIYFSLGWSLFFPGAKYR